MGRDVVTLFLCGDVMLGRGVDQILPFPGNPALNEEIVRDARDYVTLAEAANGPIPRPVEAGWPWGEVLAVLQAARPDARVLNLETSVTRADTFAPGKGVHYRMAPENLPALAAARPDVLALANNHVLDFDQPGLAETLETLSDAGFATAGAGQDPETAWRPAVVPLPGGGRLVVVAFGLPSSGIPPWWAASGRRPGVALLPDLSDASADRVVERACATRRGDDVVVASVHWGSNWGFEVSDEHVRFAHRLVDGGVDVVHGHSSHHPRPVEVYRDRLVLYGCGDFIDDYEGIPGHEEYRDDLRLAYFASLDAATGALVALRLVALQARRMRLCRATGQDCQWLAGLLTRISLRFGACLDLAPDLDLTLRRVAA